MIYKLLSVRYLLPIFFLSLSFSLSAQPTVEEGKTLFKNYCAQCHAKNMTSDATGPSLSGFEERWADYPREDLLNWVKNSQALIAEEDSISVIHENAAFARRRKNHHTKLFLHKVNIVNKPFEEFINRKDSFTKAKNTLVKVVEEELSNGSSIERLVLRLPALKSFLIRQGINL